MLYESRKLVYISVLILASYFSFGQPIDSLLRALKNARHDTSKIRILNILIDAENDDKVWPGYNDQLVKISESHLKNITFPKTAIDTFYFVQLSNGLSNKGLVAHNKGDYKTAVLYYNKSLDMEKITNNRENIAAVYNNIGGVYSDQKLLKEAIDYFKKSLELRILMNDERGLAQSYGNLGSMYDEVKDTALAREYYLKSLEYSLKTNSMVRVAIAYDNLAALYSDEGNYQKALEFFNKSLDVHTKINNKRGVCNVLGNISNLYVTQKKYNEAKPYALRALQIAKEVGIPFHIKAEALNLYTIESKIGTPEKVLEYYKLFIRMRDSISSVENSKAALKMQVQFEYDKQKAVDEAVHARELLLSAEREQKQKLMSLGIGIVLLLMIVLAMLIYNRLQVTNRQKKVIEEQKLLVEEKSLIIEEKQKEIIDSISYARRIQHTLLANETLLNEHVPDHFILFKPKDIVSGDFYWATSVRSVEMEARGNKTGPGSELFYLAVCDSTGHGVPGAFMSLLNISFMNEAITERNITDPHNILNHVRTRLIEEISKDGGQDGMDGILMTVQKSRGKTVVNYAAANNHPVIVTSGRHRELPKDKMPVGKGERTESFTLHTVDVNKGDVIYLYTDGFADQFGGPKGKKFKYKALNSLLESIASLPMQEQKLKLEAVFDSWRGNLEQVDDVCVIGFRL